MERMVKLAMNVSDWNNPEAVEKHIREVLHQVINNPDDPITVAYLEDTQDAEKVMNLMLFAACLANVC